MDACNTFIRENKGECVSHSNEVSEDLPAIYSINYTEIPRYVHIPGYFRFHVFELHQASPDHVRILVAARFLGDNRISLTTHCVHVYLDALSLSVDRHYYHVLWYDEWILDTIAMSRVMRVFRGSNTLLELHHPARWDQSVCEAHIYNYPATSNPILLGFYRSTMSKTIYSTRLWKVLQI